MRRSRVDGLFRRVAADRSGNVALIAGILLPVGVMATAIAIDEGALYGERRTLQGLADLAAISAAANPTKPEQAALATLSQNGLQATLGRVEASVPIDTRQPAVTVTQGRYRKDGTVAVEKRFVAGAVPANAFRVELHKTAGRYFGGAFMPPIEMQTVATGYASAEAAFTVGSRLASLDGGILNAILGATLGTSLSLSVMDYRALLDARLPVLPLLDGIVTDNKLKVLTYSDVLGTELPVRSVLSAMAAMPGMDRQAASALRTLATATSSTLKLRLNSVFGLGASAALPLGAGSGGMEITATALEIVQAAASAANGEKQVQANLATGLPGILGVKLTLAVGERAQASPWLVAGEEGAMLRTAQTRLLLDLTLGGPGGALGVSVHLPIYIELAFAEAQLTDVRCQRDQLLPSGVDIKARPGVAKLRIADPDPWDFADFSRSPTLRSATLVDTPLASVRGSAVLSISDTKATTLHFDAREIANHTTKTVSTRDFAVSATTSLLGSLSLQVDVLGLGVGLPSTLGATLSRSLQGQATAIDQLLGSVLTVLGVSLGQADVTVEGGLCGRPVLVQ